MCVDPTEQEIVEKLKQIHYTLPGRVIRKIVKYQFKFIANRIKEGDLKPVFLHNFGTFKLKRSVLKSPTALAMLLTTLDEVTPHIDNNEAYTKYKQREFDHYKSKYDGKESNKQTGEE